MSHDSGGQDPGPQCTVDRWTGPLDPTRPRTNCRPTQTKDRPRLQSGNLLSCPHKSVAPSPGPCPLSVRHSSQSTRSIPLLLVLRSTGPLSSEGRRLSFVLTELRLPRPPPYETLEDRVKMCQDLSKQFPQKSSIVYLTLRNPPHSGGPTLIFRGTLSRLWRRPNKA